MRTLRNQLWLVVALLLALVVGGAVDMPHGQRDWSNIGAEETVHGLADMAELAARQWSPDTFNREGNVLAMDSFEFGAPSWSLEGYGTGGMAVVSAEEARSAGYSVKLVAGSDGAQLASATRAFAYPVLGYYGLEWSASFDSTCSRFDGLIRHFDGATLYDYQVKYDPVAAEILIYDGDSGWVTVASGAYLWSTYNFFNTFKLVADLENNRFHRLIVNENEYDLSDYVASETADTSAPQIIVFLRLMSQSGYTSTTYVDDVILTQNEPP